MTIDVTTVHRARPVAKAWHWFARWADAIEMTESAHLEQRVRAIELELADLRNAKDSVLPRG